MYVFMLVMYLQANKVYQTLEKGPNVQSSLQIWQLLKQKQQQKNPPKKTTTKNPRKLPPEKKKETC